jgi:hypothetical protein
MIDEFINGRNEQYGKPVQDKKTGIVYFKTTPLVDKFKRNGSQDSPGTLGNESVEGGLGKGFNHVTVNIPKINGKSAADGQRFIRKKHSDKVTKSYGTVFNFGGTIKAISTINDEHGNRFLDKSGAIVIDYLAAQYPNSTYAKILAFMEKHDIDSLSTEDTTKYTGGVKTIKMFEGENFIEPDITEEKIKEHIYFIPTSSYRVQQDLVNDGKFYESTTPIQRTKNDMSNASASDIAKMYNRIGIEKTNKIIDTIKNTNVKEWRAYILGELGFNKEEIEDVIKEEQENDRDFGDIDKIEELLVAGAEFEHPHVQKWLHTFMANTITKQALGRTTNKALAVEMGYLPSDDFKLKEYRVVDGKVYLPEAMVPYNSRLRVPSKPFPSLDAAKKEIMSKKGKYMDMFTGFDIKGNPLGIHEHEIEEVNGEFIIPGEFFLYTRIPADAPHSTTLARVKDRLPKQMQNIIITDFKSQQIAGSDFDGDQRHIEGFFKETEKVKDKKLSKVNINDDTKYGRANKAFHINAQEFYKQSNFESFTNAINTEHYDEILENLPKETNKRQDSPEAYISARIKNNVGLATVGMNANAQSQMDWLKANDSTIKVQEDKAGNKYNALSLPIISIKKGVYSLSQSKGVYGFSKETSVKDAAGDFQNLSLDNVKDPKIERLGLNEVTAKMFNLAIYLKPNDVKTDEWMESVIGFFTLPTTKKYLEAVRNSKEIHTTADADKVFENLAEQITGDTFISKERDVDLNASDLTSDKSMNVLRKLKILNDMTYDLDKIHSVIRLTESAPKSWADLQIAMDNYIAVESNGLRYIDTDNFISRPYLKAAENAINASEAYFEKFGTENTNTATKLRYQFENDWKASSKKDVARSMNKNQLMAFSKAINSTMLMNSRNRDTKFEVWGKEFVNTIQEKKANKPSALVDALQIDKGKVELREDLKRADITNYELEKINEELNRLYNSESAEDKQFLKDFIDYNIFESEMSSSKESGSYAVLFTDKIHVDISKDMKAQKELWNNEFSEEEFSAIYNEILSKNTILESAGQRENSKGKKMYEPFLGKKFEEVTKEKETNNSTIDFSPSEATNYSGAAIGSDTVWANIGKEFGIGKQVDYRPDDLKKLNTEQLKEVESAYRQSVKDLGRKILDANSFSGGLVRRDYLQAKAADAIFAIIEGFDVNGYPKGGTGYAVSMGIRMGKPVYVFSQEDNEWLIAEKDADGTFNGSWTTVDIPILTKKYAGIGTRKINESGKQAIKDVYEKTFVGKEKEAEMPTPKTGLSPVMQGKFDTLLDFFKNPDNLTQKQKDALKEKNVNLETIKPNYDSFGLLNRIKCNP